MKTLYQSVCSSGSKVTHTVDRGQIPTANLAVSPVTYLLVSVLPVAGVLGLSAIKNNQPVVLYSKYTVTVLSSLQKKTSV